MDLWFAITTTLNRGLILRNVAFVSGLRRSRGKSGLWEESHFTSPGLLSPIRCCLLSKKQGKMGTVSCCRLKVFFEPSKGYLKRGWGFSPVAQCLPGKHEVLSSIHDIPPHKKKKGYMKKNLKCYLFPPNKLLGSFYWLQKVSDSQYQVQSKVQTLSSQKAPRSMRVYASCFHVSGEANVVTQ